jgi:hypothetical protein
MWGAMKGAVRNDKPHTLLEMKEAITNFIRHLFDLVVSCHCKQDKMMHV